MTGGQLRRMLADRGFRLRLGVHTDCAVPGHLPLAAPSCLPVPQPRVRLDPARVANITTAADWLAARTGTVRP